MDSASRSCSSRVVLVVVSVGWTCTLPDRKTHSFQRAATKGAATTLLTAVGKDRGHTGGGLLADCAEGSMECLGFSTCARPSPGPGGMVVEKFLGHGGGGGRHMKAMPFQKEAGSRAGGSLAGPANGDHSVLPDVAGCRLTPGDDGAPGLGIERARSSTFGACPFISCLISIPGAPSVCSSLTWRVLPQVSSRVARHDDFTGWTLRPRLKA